MEDLFMDKPLLLVREDFIKNMTNLINNSKLPVIILESILQDFLNQTKYAIKQQYDAEKEEYEKSISDIKKNKKE